MAPYDYQYGTPIGPLCLEKTAGEYISPQSVKSCLGIISDGVAGLETTACRLLELHPYTRHGCGIAYEIRLFQSDYKLYKRGDDLVWAREGQCPALLCYLDYYYEFTLRGFSGPELFSPFLQLLRDQNG